jgi:hypothetical protein
MRKKPSSDSSATISQSGGHLKQAFLHLPEGKTPVNVEEIRRGWHNIGASKRKLLKDMNTRRIINWCENQLISTYQRDYGARATIEGFERWRNTLDGKAAASRIVDHMWKSVGEPNPNSRWDTRTLWRGRQRR